MLLFELFVVSNVSVTEVLTPDSLPVVCASHRIRYNFVALRSSISPRFVNLLMRVSTILMPLSVLPSCRIAVGSLMPPDSVNLFRHNSLEFPMSVMSLTLLAVHGVLLSLSILTLFSWTICTRLRSSRLAWCLMWF